MTTGPSTSPSNRTATAVTEPPPSVEPLTFAAPAAHAAVAPPDHPPAGDEHRDPVGDLVLRLVTLLEESPEYAQTVVEVLRAAAVDRPVEDVARLVAELTRPPRDADSADATIRAAIESRDVEDVTRLMALLHRAPLQPHCGEEAVRAAATGRPVAELVELIGRLTEEHGRNAGGATRQPGPSATPDRETITGGGLSPGSAPTLPTTKGKNARVRVRDRSPRIRGDRPDQPLFWPSWLAAAALLVCAAACFPLHRDGASYVAHGMPLGASAACVVLAVLVAFRPSTTLLAAGAVVPATLAGLVLLEDRVRSTTLSRAVDPMLVPPWSAGLTAVCASLASLAALLLLLMVQMADQRPAPRSAAGRSATPD
jgi:hypothetical protein